MLIPYQYNKMAAGATVIDPNRAIYGTRGVFTFLRNGSCNQSCMTMQERYLVSSNISRMEVSSAGLALRTTVGQNASVLVKSGGVVSSSIVNSGANIQVSSGGYAKDTEINYSGYLYVSPGGSASGVNIHSRGYAYIYSNASVCNADVSYGAGLYGQGTSITFDSTVVSSGADFNAGQSSGVQVLHTTITQNASFWCYNGMNVTHTTVMPGAYLGVSSGGKCYDVTVGSGGRINHGVWGHDSETVVTGSNQYGSFYLSNGTACNYVLADGMDQQLYYYASALSTVMSSGGSQFVSFGAVAQYNTIFSQGYQRIFSSGRAMDTVVNSYGSQFADFFGTAIRTTICSSGWLYVTNFGRAVSTTVEKGGSCFCSYGGQMTSVNVSGWQMFSNGCGGTHVTVAETSAWCYLRYACSGRDFNVSSGGSLHISQNCEVDGVNVSDGGRLEVYSMCQVSNVSAGSCSVNMGGYCGFTSTTIGSGARMWGSNFCDWQGFILEESAYASIYYTCGMTDVSVGPSAYLYLSQNCSAVNLNIADGGTAWICNSCSLTNVTLGLCATLTASLFTNLENVQLSSGAVMWMHSSQCRATNVAVSEGGSFYLSRYNYATSVTVDSGGLFFVASGASAFAVTSSAGANITVETGGYIEYVQ